MCPQIILNIFLLNYIFPFLFEAFTKKKGQFFTALTFLYTKKVLAVFYLKLN